MKIPLDINTSVGGDSTEDAARNGTSAQYKDNSHAISYGAISVEDFRNVIFGVRTCKNDDKLIVGMSSVNTGIDTTAGHMQIKDGLKFTYDFDQRALYKPWKGNPNGNYIWVAFPKGSVSHLTELESRSYRFARVMGYSGNDSPQEIEFRFSLEGDYIVGISDSRFGVGLPYNVIVKPEMLTVGDNEEYYID